MKMVCISDTHNKHEEIDCGSGDILIHAGDATGRGTFEEIVSFLKWFSKQDFTHKILIAGNHDWGFEKEAGVYENMCQYMDIIYLNDSGVTIRNMSTGDDLKIYGSPVQPEFCNWAFNRSIYKHDGRYKQITEHWDLIPDDTDILITHGPPYGIRDSVEKNIRVSGCVEHVGCPHLLEAIKRIKPRYHVFGHIHEEHGKSRYGRTHFINASQLDDRYLVTYKPIALEIV